MDKAQRRLARLHADLGGCRRCAEAGYPIGSRPILSGPASAQVMVVGQAPAGVEAENGGLPFGPRRGGRPSLLWTWLAQAGWSEADFRATQYITAITKCYPGPHKNGRGDRRPTAREMALCQPWREQELAIIQPQLIIPLGRMAIEQFLPHLKGKPLDSFIGQVGQVFEWGRADVVPLPHPSGRSRWLNRAQNQALVEKALEQLKRLKETLEL